MVLSQSFTKSFIQKVRALSSSLLPHSNSSLLSTSFPHSPCWELYFLRLPYKVPQTECFKITERTSSQGGGIGRHDLPLSTTTPKLHIQKIQNNHQLEIKLNGSLTTTELKKPHPSRLVGGAQTWIKLPIPEGGE